MNPPIHLLKPHTHPYRIELKCLNLFKVYHYLTDLGGLPLGVGGVGRCGCGVGRLTDFKSSNRIEIFWFIQVLLCFNWFGGSPLEVGGCRCGCGSLHKFQIFKQNQNICFIDFWPISGVPPMGVGVGGWGGSLSGCVCGGCPMHAHMHMHAHMCMTS